MIGFTRLLRRPLIPHKFAFSVLRTYITRAMAVDASVPIRRGMEKLDRDAFKKTVKVVAAQISPAITNTVLKAPAMRGVVIDLPKVKSVMNVPGGKERLVLTRFSSASELSQETKDFLASQNAKLVDYDIQLNYDYWTSDDILSSVLPEELLEGAPSGFAIVGHIAHVNLNEEYLPYKYLIGQVILDKNGSIKTVVNKVDQIANQFRVFSMEVLAGEPNFVVEHHESDCRFLFDFSQVYWNSRLHTEHGRLVDLFKPEDVVADVFAGVGPFAIPAAKKGCGVFANDLNPNSYEYLEKNIVGNKVQSLVRASCQDGREFIRSVIVRALEEPLPAYNPPLSRTLARKAERHAKQPGQQAASASNDNPSEKPKRSRISHFVMNLPDSAITFLDAFRGVLSPQNVGGRDLSGIYGSSDLPMVHCHCFTRELEFERAQQDIRQRVEEQLGHPLGEEVTVHLVRSVSPNKEMYCVSFRLPREVAFEG